MNRLFNTVVDPTASGGAPLRRWIPAMDLVEGPDQFVLRADLPGMKQEDVSIEFEDNVLTIAGERKSQHEERDEGFHRVERAFGAFSRTLTLPKGIDPEAINARFEDGVLEVTIPKPEESKPRRISIGVGENRAAIEGTSSDRVAASGSESGNGNA
jgi:HSP20 family protein